MKTPTHTIQLEAVTKSFQGADVLKGIDLHVARGEVLALLGPNGAGKTTTVRILSTLLGFDTGTAYVNGHSVKDNPAAVRASIGLSGQYAAVDEYLTAHQNLEMMGRLYHLSRRDAVTRAEELLTQFDLQDSASKVVKTFSGGMRRRLDLAASLIATPPVLFLDEPTTGLDPRSRLGLWDIIEQLVEADVTILLTTQYLEEADRLADRIAVLDHGRIIAEGTPDALKDRVGKERLDIIVETSEQFAVAVAALGKQVVKQDEGELLLGVTIDNALHDIQHVLRIAEENKVGIKSLSLHKPTLDDVFLHFTGHQAVVDAEITQGKETHV